MVSRKGMISSGFHSPSKREAGTGQNNVQAMLNQKTVHTRHRITYRHGIPRITVIAGTDSHEIVLSGFPAAYQYCTAIFSATSTATEPESA